MLRSAHSPPQTPTDAELLHLFLRSRDDAAFGRLVARHGEPVRRVATRATGNPSAAEDVAQAAFIVLSRRPRAAWLSARCRGSALPWLVRTTRYAASTWRRTEARRRRHESAAAVPERVDPSQPGELTEAVAAALARMNRGERRLITLRHLDEKPWPDVAQQVGMTPEAARKATARALARLRERLGSSGVIVTPAALAIALSTLARPSYAAISLTTTTSAFQIARGVITMMKIQTAGLAGTVLLAAVMGVGVIGGPGAASPTLAAENPSQEGRNRQEERESTRGQNRGAQEDDDRPEEFTANEHQPTVTLADGTKLTLLGVSNGEDGWWHANGTRARAPRHYLPRGMGVSNMTVTSDDSPILDLSFYVESPWAGEETAEGEVRHWINLAGVMVGSERQEPDSVGIGINSTNGRASWRVIVSDATDSETSEAWLCITTGAREKVGEVARREDGSWKADEGAQRWVRPGMDGEKLFLEPVKAGNESAAISVRAIGGEKEHHHGHLSEGRMVFGEESGVRAVERIEIYRRPLEVVRLSNMAREPGQATQPQVRLAEEPMVLITDSHSGSTATAGTHNRSTVQVGGSVQGHAESTHSGHTATAGGGKAGATGQGGSRATAGGGGSGGGGGGSGQNNDDPDKD